MLGRSGLTLPNEKCITDCDADAVAFPGGHLERMAVSRAESTVPHFFLWKDWQIANSPRNDGHVRPLCSWGFTTRDVYWCFAWNSSKIRDSSTSSIEDEGARQSLWQIDFGYVQLWTQSSLQNHFAIWNFCLFRLGLLAPNTRKLSNLCNLCWLFSFCGEVVALIIVVTCSVHTSNSTQRFPRVLDLQEKEWQWRPCDFGGFVTKSVAALGNWNSWVSFRFFPFLLFFIQLDLCFFPFQTSVGEDETFWNLIYSKFLGHVDLWLYCSYEGSTRRKTFYNVWYTFWCK